MNSSSWPPWALHESDLYSHSLYEKGYALAPCGSVIEGFRPPIGEIADFTIVWDGRRWHLFHIVRQPLGDCYFPGHEIYFGHSTSPDLVKWTHHAPVLLTEPGTWRGYHLWAPFVIKLDDHENDTWLMFYTGVDQQHQQRIGMAISYDLFDWKYCSSEPLFDPGSLDWTASCTARDPHALWHDERLLLYHTSSAKGDNKAVIGLSSVAKQELLEYLKIAPPAGELGSLIWRDHGPLLSLPSGRGICPGMESCCVIQAPSDRWVIFFGYENGLRYAMSSDPYTFSQSQPEHLVDGLTGLEVLSTVGDKDNVWLVACFAWPNYREVSCGRLIFGELRWEKERPFFHRITDEDRIKLTGMEKHG